MSQCAPHRDAVLDPEAPRPADHEQHLQSCAACRDLARAHRAALALRGAHPIAPRRAVAPVVGRAGLVAVVLALAAIGVWRSSAVPQDAAGVAVAAATSAGEGPALAPERRPGSAESEARWLVFWVEQDVRALESERHPAVADPAYRSFGPLARWLAPPSEKGSPLTTKED